MGICVTHSDQMVIRVLIEEKKRYIIPFSSTSLLPARSLVRTMACALTSSLANQVIQYVRCTSIFCTNQVTTVASYYTCKILSLLCLASEASQYFQLCKLEFID